MAGKPDLDSDFVKYLAERNLTPAQYQAMSEEMRQYLHETWQWEHHIFPHPSAPMDDAEEVELTQAVVTESKAVVRPTSLRERAWIPLGGLLLVALILMQLRFRSVPPRGEAAPMGTQLPSYAPSASPPASSELSRERPAWQMVGYAGQRTSTAIPFTVSGAKWRIVWVTRPSAKGPADFTLTIKRPDGRVVKPAVHVIGEGEGEMVLRGVGDYVLDIASDQRYEVKVYDFL